MQRNKWTNTVHLQGVFDKYSKHFVEVLQQQLLATPRETDTFIATTRANFEGKEGRAMRESLPESLAAIFAVWSVSFSKEFYAESKNMEAVLQPHPIQVKI
jgi:hypothetical protein